jgi:hypothetical protein
MYLIYIGIVLRLGKLTVYFLDEWDWVHLVRRPLIDLLYQSRKINDNVRGAVGGMRISRGNRSTRRKSAPVSLFPQKIPDDLIWARTQAAEVASRGLTAWAMARPMHEVKNTTKNFSNCDRNFNQWSIWMEAKALILHGDVEWGSDINTVPSLSILWSLLVSETMVYIVQLIIWNIKKYFHEAESFMRIWHRSHSKRLS